MERFEGQLTLKYLVEESLRINRRMERRVR